MAEEFVIHLFDRLMNPIGELSESAGNLSKCVRVEEINGEHSLSITTPMHLEVGTRAIAYIYRRNVWGDGRVHTTGGWQEWVLDEASEHHEDTEYGENDYHFCWSAQSDLKGVYGPTQQPGMASPASAFDALVAALSGQSMWGYLGALGLDKDKAVMSGAIMPFGESAWDRLSIVVKYWGLEIEASVDNVDYGLHEHMKRLIALRDHIGNPEVTQLLEYGHNLTGITRTPPPGPYFCRVIPLGNGETYDADDGVATYEEPLTIEEVNGGKNYISDPDAEMTFRTTDGRGGYTYPTIAVSYSTDDPEELLALAREDLHAHTRPTVSYEGTVRAFNAAEMRAEDLCLGDEVQVVDHKFNRDFPLGIQERVIRIEHDELRHDDTKITIGKFVPTIEKTMAAALETIGVKNVAAHQLPLEVDVAEGTPELSVYTIDTPTSEGISYTIPSYDVPDYSTSIGDIESRISDIESGGGYGGDGWTHMVDGVEQSTGTVDFKTVAPEKSDDKPVDKNGSVNWGSSEKPTSKKNINVGWGSKGFNIDISDQDDGGGGGAGHSF